MRKPVQSINELCRDISLVIILIIIYNTCTKTHVIPWAPYSPDLNCCPVLKEHCFSEIKPFSVGVVTNGYLLLKRKLLSLYDSVFVKLPGGLSVVGWGVWAPLVLREGSGGLGARIVTGGSRMSRYLDTINTEMKYTIARDRNCACLLSSWQQNHSVLEIEGESVVWVSKTS